MKRWKLTLERLRAVLRYYPETGDFLWLATLSSNVKAGRIAGTKAGGYVNISIADTMELP